MSFITGYDSIAAHRGDGLLPQLRIAMGQAPDGLEHPANLVILAQRRAGMPVVCAAGPARILEFVRPSDSRE